MEGKPRGFWARGPRWVAHGGVLGELSAPPGPGRFGTVEEGAAPWAGMGDGDEALRFYGGFSFRADHLPEEEWGAFPAALFHLPEVEFDGEGDGPARLRVRVPRGEDATVARARAEMEAERLVHRMEAVRDRTLSRITPRSVPAEVREGDRGEWMGAVERTLEAIREGRFSKAVLARTRDVVLGRPVAPVDVLMAIWNQHPGTHAFLFEPRPGRILLGAAPEVLVTLRDGHVSATAVAGSSRRGESRDEDTRLGAALLASRKDRAEHSAVVDYMVQTLEPLAGPVAYQDAPHLLRLARIQHLETELEADARDGSAALELVQALHPTPAVCGVPRNEALAFLKETEPFRRGWYAGPVGWFDSEGEGHFVPALRTAVGDGRTWRLYAGAGIVEGSDPASEWAETGIKFVPVLRALAASGAQIEGVEP